MHTDRLARPLVAPIGVLALTLLALIAVRPCAAQWPANGVSLDGNTGSYGQMTDFMQLSRDPSGDVLATWSYHWSTNSFFKSVRVTPAGSFESGWGPYALVIPLQTPAVAAPLDGAGGCFEGTAEFDNVSLQTRIFARHILPNGSIDPSWPALGPSAPVSTSGYLATSTSDGAGGAFVTWLTSYDLNAASIVSAHIGSNGIHLPAHGVYGNSLGLGPGAPEVPLLSRPPSTTTDGAGGVGMVWLGTGTVCFQHMLASGTSTQTPSYDMGSAPSAQYPFVAIFPSGPNQFICTWIDTIGGLPELTAQRLDGDGNLDPAWPASGLQVAASSSTNFAAHAVSDGADGVMLAWSVGGAGVHALHLHSNGTPAPGWPASGVAVGDGTTPTTFAIAMSDPGGLLYSGGGALWWYLDDGTLDPSTPAGGLPLLTGNTTRLLPQALIADGSGGAYVAWTSNYAYPQETGPAYLGHYDHPGTLGVGPEARVGVFALRRVSPNPSHGEFSIELSLADAAPARLELFDLAGRRIRSVDLRGAGDHSVHLTELASAAPGLYVVRLEQGAWASSRRVAIVR